MQDPLEPEPGQGSPRSASRVGSLGPGPGQASPGLAPRVGPLGRGAGPGRELTESCRPAGPVHHARRLRKLPFS